MPCRLLRKQNKKHAFAIFLSLMWVSLDIRHNAPIFWRLLGSECSVIIGIRWNWVFYVKVDYGSITTVDAVWANWPLSALLYCCCQELILKCVFVRLCVSCLFHLFHITLEWPLRCVSICSEKKTWFVREYMHLQSPRTYRGRSSDFTCTCCSLYHYVFILKDLWSLTSVESEKLTTEPLKSICPFF